MCALKGRKFAGGEALPRCRWIQGGLDKRWMALGLPRGPPLLDFFRVEGLGKEGKGSERGREGEAGRGRKRQGESFKCYRE